MLLVLFVNYFDLFACIPKLSQGVNAKSQCMSVKTARQESEITMVECEITK